MSGFAIGVTPVAFGLASGLVLNHTRNAGPVSRLARLQLGPRYCRGESFLLGGFGLKPICLFGFYPLKHGAPLFPSCSNRLAFRLSNEPGRFCCFLCGTIGFKTGSFGVGGGAPTLGKVIVFGVFQNSVPVTIGMGPDHKPI